MARSSKNFFLVFATFRVVNIKKYQRATQMFCLLS
jgi:hypothetical protein